MKKIILLFTMIVTLLMSGNAQVVLQENFDTTSTSALPTGWTKFNVDGLTPYYTWITDAWVSLMVSGTSISSKAAWSTSYYTPAGVANDWMFTPAIIIPSSSPILQFTEYTPNASYPDGYEVRIMTVAPTSSNLTSSTVLLAVTAAATTPAQKTVNLSAYAGQTVYIGWHNNSNDKLILGIDDIVVKGQHNNDIAITAITTPVNVAVGNNNIIGSVRNVGLNTITSYDVTYSINNGVTSAVYSVTGQSIVVGGTGSFTHNVPANLAAGYDTIFVTITNVNGAIDSNNYDNTLKKVVNCLPDNDIALTAITTPAYVITGNTNITGTVKSMSVTPITSFDVKYKIDGGAYSAIYSVTGQNLGYLATYNFTHNVPASITAGTHSLEVTISNINGATDPNLTNNVLTKTINSAVTLPKQKVVLEEYTGIYCQYCPDGHKKANLYKALHPNDVFIINIHQGSYANQTGSDPNFKTPFGDALAAQTGLTGYPAATINRHVFSPLTVTATSDRTQWSVFGDQILTLNTYASMTVTASINYTTRLLTVNTTTNYEANGPALNLMNVALLQNNLEGPQTGGSTYNPAQVLPNGKYNHQHMLRHLLTGQWGDSITVTTSGTVRTKTYTYTIPANLNNIVYDLYNLHIVAYLTEGKQEIVTGAEYALPTAVNEVNNTIDLSFYPNPAKDNVQLSFNLTKKENVNINIYNSIGGLVYSQNQGELQTGNHNVNIKLNSFAKGIYFVNVKAGENIITNKLIIE
jgi:hypothetical protein